MQTRRHRMLLPTLLVVLAGCAPELPPEAIVELDYQRTGRQGELGPHGVELLQLRLDPAGELPVDVEIAVPTGLGAHFSPVIVVQGGFVPKERYRWIAAHVASRGYTAISAQHPVDIAFADISASSRALRAARAWSSRSSGVLSGQVAEVPATIVGHSLGGVIGAKVWNELGPEEVRHLALLASVPDEADTFTEGEGRRVVSLTGSEDARLTPDEMVTGAESFANVEGLAVDLVIVDGMNHYQLTDEPTEDELSTDGAATIDLEEAQRRTLEVLDGLCDDAANRAAWSYPPAGTRRWPEGVSPAPEG